MSVEAATNPGRDSLRSTASDGLRSSVPFTFPASGGQSTSAAVVHPDPGGATDEALPSRVLYPALTARTQRDPSQFVGVPNLSTSMGGRPMLDQGAAAASMLLTTVGGVPHQALASRVPTLPVTPAVPQSGTVPATLVPRTTSDVVVTTGVSKCSSALPNLPSPTLAVTPVITPLGAMPFSVPMLGQLPPIPHFDGEGHGSGESFAEWHEHFENIAKLVGWNDHWKLVHLTSSLLATASAFHRSCSVEVRSSYKDLVATLRRIFTPVRLTAIQAQIFHNRQQGPKETVDQFAQELQKLFRLAYAGAASEGPLAEKMGQTLLLTSSWQGYGLS